MTQQTYSRREFVASSGAVVLGCGAWLKAAAAVGVRDADLVVLNAKVYTVDAKVPQAEAFAIKNGRFMAVGSGADIKGRGARKPRSSMRSR